MHRKPTEFSIDVDLDKAVLPTVQIVRLLLGMATGNSWVESGEARTRRRSPMKNKDSQCRTSRWSLQGEPLLCSDFRLAILSLLLLAILYGEVVSRLESMVTVEI